MGHPVLRKDDRLMLMDVAFIKESRDSLSRGPRGALEKEEKLMLRQRQEP